MKEIIVFTKNYGKGYTGATTSTYELIRRWSSSYKITVLTFNIVGKVNNNVNIIQIPDYFSLFKFIDKLKKKPAIWYSDDHLGFLLRLKRVQYFHTYHGNWPDALFNNGIFFFIKGCILMILYMMTIHFSVNTVTVSKHALKFVKKFNANSSVIRNGVEISGIKKKQKIVFKKPIRILMVGNIDNRKYINLIKMLKKIPLNHYINFNIDIFGRVIDEKYSRELSSYNFINIKGFKDKVPYSNYDLYLTLSDSENLSIALVEAIASGVPALGINVGGTGEVIRSNTGFLIKDFNSQQVFQFLNDKILNQNIFFDNYYIIKEFNWKNTAKLYLKMFNLR